MRLTFLGSGDAFGSGGRFQSCMYLESERSHILIDCGASSLIAMRRFGVDPALIDAILISHLHGDHFGGIPFFILDAQFISRRTKPLIIAGPPGIEQRVREAMEVLFQGSSETRQAFEYPFLELRPREKEQIGDVAVQTFPVSHSGGSTPLGLRLEAGGKVISYSGDTEWTDSLPDLARGADVFVCETYYFEKQFRYHLNYKTLVDHLSELQCQRIVLTHLGPEALERRAELTLDVAEDGLRIDL